MTWLYVPRRFSLAEFLGGDHVEARAELGAAHKVWIIVTDALGFSAQVALMQNRTEDAAALARRAVEQAHRHGLLDLPHAAYYLATCAAAARSVRLEEGDRLGDIDGARALLNEAGILLAKCDSTGIIGDLVPQVERALSASHHNGAEPTDLTDRELGVLRLMERGLSQREIARELFLSFHTIHSHTKSIYSRLGVSTREQAIEQAREQRLL